MTPARVDRGWGIAARRALERGSRISQLGLCFPAADLREREHGVPERKRPPPVIAVSNRSQMRRPAAQAFFAAIETAGEQIAPQADRARSAAEQTGIPAPRIIGCTRKAAHQSRIGCVQCQRDTAIAHAKQPQRPTGLLAKNVTRRCERRTLAGEQHNSFRSFCRKPGEGPAISARQPLPGSNPSRRPIAFGRCQRTVIEERRIDRVNGLRKTCSVDQHRYLILSSVSAFFQ